MIWSLRTLIEGEGWRSLTQYPDMLVLQSGGQEYPHLGVKGDRIFNLLPASIRTLNGVSVSEFKCELDRFLAGVPDQPTCPGRQRAAATNSLLDQLQLIF